VRRVLLGVLIGLLVNSAAASQPTPSAERRTTQNGLQVWLMTIGQGGFVWEKFGHNALWFVDTLAGVNVAYNWGIFDFEQPGFIRRFLTGDTRYWVEGYPGETLIDYYQRSDRDIMLQRLNLTPAQAATALEFSRWNAREENKYYRYDYYRDNCSTRVRDVIDRALGGGLKSATTAVGTRSYRSESLRLVDDMKLTQLGMDIALGQPADKHLTVWDEMFIPMRMRDAFAFLPVPGITTNMAPLVMEDRVIYRSQSHHERKDNSSRWPLYAIVGVLLAAELLVVGRIGERTTLVDKIFRVEALLWALAVGIAGLALLLAWTSTRHVFWYRNENLLLLNPLALWLAFLTAMSLFKGRWIYAAAIAAVVIALLSALALVAKGLPGFSQDNIAVILLFLPPNFAVAYGLWRRATSSIGSAVRS
jgi:hypothetical protein